VTERALDPSLSSHARSAGLLYLVIIACGIFSEAFIRAHLIVPGDAGITAGNILAAPGLFRTGFAADSVMLLCDVAIAVLFYVLLRPVSRTLAMLAAAFRLTQAAILGFNLLNYYAALLLLSGVEYASALETGQLQAQAMLHLQLHSHGYDLGLIFFGLSNFFLGYLISRSGYIPALLGYGLIAAGIVYLTGSYVRFLAPDFHEQVAPLYIIPLLAELGLCLWLMIKGVKTPPSAT
jgi:hypothetical protein